MKTKLLEIASKYSSESEFKDKNLSKYLLAKKLRLLKIAFPLKALPKAHKGIYKLYKDLVLVYVGYSTIDVVEAIAEHTEGSIDFNNYNYYIMTNTSDILTLASYIANKYKPRYNTNIGKEALSFQIPTASKILGTPIKGVM